MKILLVNAPYALMSRFYFPSGLAMVSAVLKEQGHEVHCLNAALEDDWERAFADTFRRVAPDVLGTGGMSPSYGNIKRLLTLGKSLDPSVTTVLGGGVLGSEPRVIEALDADIGVLGEGEHTMAELARRLQAGLGLEGVAGILHKDTRGAVVREKPRPFIDDLDALPLPDYDGFRFDLCHQGLRYHDLTTSRGCPYNCTFCYCVMGRGKHRCQSIDRVIRELRHLQEGYGMQAVGMMDEVFAVRRERLEEFCEKVTPLGIGWSAQIRLDIVDRELLDTMRRAGCAVLFYGLESMSAPVLASMNKRLKPEKAKQALELTYDSGLRVFGNFIFGDPAETSATAWETMDWWLANRKYLINLGKIDCWPGTAIYRQALERGIIADPIEYIESGCPMVNLTAMPDDEHLETIRRAWTFHEAMIFPGKLTAASQEREGGWAELLCPHCHRTARFSGLAAVPAHTDRGAHRLACTACGKEMDLPLRFPPPSLNPDGQALFDRGLDHHRRGAFDLALAAMEAMGEDAKRYPPAAYLRAFIQLGQGDPAAANQTARVALRHNPASVHLLEMCAVSYRRKGDLRACEAFFRQALLIRAARRDALTPDAVRELDPCEALLDELFPSDAVNLDSGVFWS